MIHFTLGSLPDRLSFGALTDLGAITTPTIVGAWMTRIWLGAFGEAASGRRTADVDVQVDSAETLASGEMISLLEARGYQRDPTDYPFRMSRRVKEGVRIVDLLVDRESTSADSLGFRVEGLEQATRTVVEHDLDAGAPAFRVKVPALEGAFVLRCLALQVGPTGLKFEDYVQDAIQLARLVRRSASASRGLEAIRPTGLGRRLSAVMSELFSDEDAPGSRAAALGALGDRDLASRQASALVRALVL